MGECEKAPGEVIPQRLTYSKFNILILSGALLNSSGNDKQATTVADFLYRVNQKLVSKAFSFFLIFSTVFLHSAVIFPKDEGSYHYVC